MAVIMVVVADSVMTSIRPGHTYGEGGDHLLHSLGKRIKEVKK